MSYYRDDMKDGIIRQQRKTDINAIIEALYLSVLALYLLKVSFDTTLFHIPYPVWYEKGIRILACTVILLRFGCTEYCYYKKILLCILIGALFKLSWESTGYLFLLDTALLIVGAMSIPYQKILKVGFFIGLYVLLVAILGSFTGCIADLVYSKRGHPRHSFGIVYPTDFAAHITFLSLEWWVLCNSNSTLLSGIGTLILSLLVFYYSQAKCSTVILCMLAVVMFCCYAKKRGKKHKSSHWCSYTVWHDRLLPYVMPFSASFMIILTLLYGTGSKAMSYLDTVLTGRLRLGHLAIDRYGITPFGTAFEQVGFGGRTAWSWTLGYTFVDSSYILILVRYGLTILIVICFQHVLLAKKALKNGQRTLALAVVLTAIHSMAEHHLSEAAYNLFLLLPFADLQCHNTQKPCKSIESVKGKIIYHLATMIVIVITIILFSRMLDYIRTIINLLQWNIPENHIWFILFATAILSAFFLFLWSVPKIISALCTRCSPPKGMLVCPAILPLLILSGLLWGEHIIQQSKADYTDIMDADRPVIEALSQLGMGQLYVDFVPELYKREFDNISTMIMAPEGLAYQKDITLITDSDVELEILIDAGFSYGEISPWHGVYSNCEKAKQTIQETGIVLTDYYSNQNTLDLVDMASWNDLTPTGDKTIILEGSDSSLVHGPGITIYKGILRVEYKLRLIDNAFDKGTVATAKVSSDWGRRIWGQKNIELEDFDDNGHFTCVMDIELEFSSPEMEFQLTVQDGVTLEILEITYGKTG